MGLDIIFPGMGLIGEIVPVLFFLFLCFPPPQIRRWKYSSGSLSVSDTVGPIRQREKF